MQQITIGIIISVFLLEVTLSALNYRNRLKSVPENVRDAYDSEEYRKWLDYTMESHRLSMVARIADTAILIVFLLFGFFPYIAGLASSVTSDIKLQTLAFFGIYMAVSYVLGIGFRIYQTFSIEERYGFNKSTVKTFILDQVKSLVLAVILGGPLGYLLLSMYLGMGNEFILYAWLLFMSLSLIINLLYTKVFIRLFNKITPLPDGELREKIEEIPDASSLYLGTLNLDTSNQVLGFDTDAIALLQEYDWPYNYTQFKRVLNELSVITTTTYISKENVKSILQKETAILSNSSTAQIDSEDTIHLKLDSSMTLDDISKEVIKRVLKLNNDNLTTTAKQLGISRTTLWRHLK